MDAIGARSDPRAAPTTNPASARFLIVKRLGVPNPVLMIFEDAHWTDPASLEVFGRIVDRIATLRVLLIVIVGLTNQGKCDETYRWLLCR